MADPGFLSKRERKRNQSGLTTDRYEYLGLNQAEPDLGDPLVGISSVGAKPKPLSGEAYILAAYSTRSTSGISTNRFWISSIDLTSGLSLTPGSFTVFSNDVQVGLANSFNKFNFVGSGVTVDPVGSSVDEQTGIATIRISVTDAVAKGGFSAVQYHGAGGLIQGASDFSFDPNTNRVGIGSTLPLAKLQINSESDRSLIVTDLGFVGIGSTIPQSKLTVQGDVRVSGASTFVGLSTFQNGIFVSGIATSRLLNVGIGGTIITTTGIGSVGVGIVNPSTNFHVAGPSRLNRISVVKTSSNLVLESGQFYAFYSGGLTLTLPASPDVGATLRIVNRTNTTTTIIGRNGSNIMGVADDIQFDEAFGSYAFTFIDASDGWALSK